MLLNNNTSAFREPDGFDVSLKIVTQKKCIILFKDYTQVFKLAWTMFFFFKLGFTFVKIFLQVVTFIVTYICASYLNSKPLGMQTKLDISTKDLVKI